MNTYELSEDIDDIISCLRFLAANNVTEGLLILYKHLVYLEEVKKSLEDIPNLATVDYIVLMVHMCMSLDISVEELRKRLTE